MMSSIRINALKNVRGVATASVAGTAPPVEVYGLSGKYAGALYTAAIKAGAPTLKAVESDLLLVRSTLASTPASGEFLLNPVLSATARTASIKSLLATASPKAATSDITLNFFQVMADNGRLYEAEKVIDDFLEIMSAHRGEVKVTITTAVALEKDLQSRLEASLKLSELAGKGKTLIIQNKINEAVLGGLIVDFGDKTVDLSVKSRVNQLNASLQEPI